MTAGRGTPGTNVLLWVGLAMTAPPWCSRSSAPSTPGEAGATSAPEG